jgi:hypothetical protein
MFGSLGVGAKDRKPDVPEAVEERKVATKPQFTNSKQKKTLVGGDSVEAI